MSTGGCKLTRQLLTECFVTRDCVEGALTTHLRGTCAWAGHAQVTFLWTEAKRPAYACGQVRASTKHRMTRARAWQVTVRQQPANADAQADLLGCGSARWWAQLLPARGAWGAVEGARSGFLMRAAPLLVRPRLL